MKSILSDFKIAEMVYGEERECVLLARGVSNGFPFVIISHGIHPCAYLGVPSNDVLANADYNILPIDCHGGLTFGAEGDGKFFRDAGTYWYGWDYGHAGDYSGYSRRLDNDGKKWSTDEILNEVWSVAYGFEQLKKLSEHILLQWARKMNAGVKVQ